MSCLVLSCPVLFISLLQINKPRANHLSAYPIWTRRTTSVELAETSKKRLGKDPKDVLCTECVFGFRDSNARRPF
jgi:hypothetical protein